MATDTLTAYRIQVAADTLTDLKARLDHTRWAPPTDGAGWSAGTDPAYLRELVDYWRTSYDWRREEERLNRHPHFRAEIDGIGIHFVHVRGKGPAPFPLLLTHGYPDSFHRFDKILGPLTDPEAFGGRAEDAFDVVVPDLPGYGFSDGPTQKGATLRVHELWDHLMTQALGYARYGAHGGDRGGTVTEQLAHRHPRSVAAIHLTDVPFQHLFRRPDDATDEERKFFAQSDQWVQKEGAYALIQSTKPASLAPALNDSPAGLAAWMIEKFRAWSDCNGRIESKFTPDELLTHVMIYWVTQTIGSSFATYYDAAHASPVTWVTEAVKDQLRPSHVPAAFALFPRDISSPPRHWAERFFTVERWIEMPRGGHFAAWEEPTLLAEDLREWFRGYR